MAKSRERPRLAHAADRLRGSRRCAPDGIPVLLMLASSVKPLSECYTYPPHVLPSKFTFASLLHDLPRPQFGTDLFTRHRWSSISFVGIS